MSSKEQLLQMIDTMPEQELLLLFIVRNVDNHGDIYK